MSLRRGALWFLLCLVLAAAAALCRPNASYSYQNREATLAGTSWRYPAGTDDLGRDRMVRVAAALLLSLVGSVAAAAITTAAAAGVGSLAAFGPAAVGWSAMLLCDVFLALPWMFLLMMVRSALPLTTSPAHSAAVTFLVLAALGWPACARAVYRGAVAQRTSGWMLHARATGLHPAQMVRHLLPNLLPLLIPQFLVSIPAFVIAEANLGALGLGISEPLPSWGGMLYELNNSAMLLETRWVFFPLALLVVVLLALEGTAAEA